MKKMCTKENIVFISSLTKEMESVMIEQTITAESSSTSQQQNINGNSPESAAADSETFIPIQRPRRMSDVIDSLGNTPPPSPQGRASWFGTDTGGGGGFGHRPRKRTSTSGSEETSPPDTGYESLLDSCDSGRKVEMTDANPLVSEYSSVEVKEAVMVVEKDALEYNMKHPRRGKAVILNHDSFDGDEEERTGSSVDVENLISTFSSLGFEVEVHNNLLFKQIQELIDKLANEDHSDADCFVMIVLTHGMTGGVLHSKDVLYKFDNLCQCFCADRCITLAGKPKLFFVQACRGKELDSGVQLRRRTETDSGQLLSYKIPREADFLIAYSSSEGYYSWRNPQNGTWFIQSLCEELKESAATTDLLTLLTRTARRVALDFESYNDICPWMNEQKQIPTFMSKLIRDVYFRPK